MQAVLKENLTKAEVLEQYQAIAGVRDVSISVGEGEVFCIMGLSGSGKSTLVRHINGVDLGSWGPKTCGRSGHRKSAWSFKR